MKEFFEKYRDLAEEHCPNSTWYVVQKVGYTREEIEEAVRELIPIDLRSEEMYQGFLTSNLGESMQILKNSTSFYHDEKLYTFLDIYNMSEGGRKEYPFDVTLPEYDDEWLECYPLVIQRCSKSETSYGPYYGYAHEEVIAFIESHIVRIKSRK